jgi:AraC family transcriptional regulator, regulatory protein of adaptative response / methylphosphotriester-DNA alkyltransferase methyltransferase
MSGPGKRPSTVASRRVLFEEAADIVRREYARELVLEEIARRAASSRRQLQRAFSEAGGTTFRRYLQEVRMERAAELLNNGDIPIKRVAIAVGYRQPAQFAKAFRRHYGRTPATFRADRHKDGSQPG